MSSSPSRGLGTSGASAGGSVLQVFINFLNNRRVLTRDSLPRLFSFYSTMDRRLGQLCVLKRYISFRDVLFILGRQADEDLRFGEVGVKYGLLKAEQLKDVVSIQQNSFLLFTESLRALRVVPEEEIGTLLVDFQQYLQAVLSTPGGPVPDRAIGEHPGTALDREQLRGVLRKVKGLGALPAVMERLLAATRDPEKVDFDRLAELITSDANVSAQLLRVVNSVMFGGMKRIGGISAAIRRIGVLGVRNVTLALMAVDKFKIDDQVLRSKLWMHAVMTSQWARVLARQRGLQPEDDALVAGLLHDVGRPIILQCFPQAASAVEKLIAEGRSAEESERWMLGHTHADIGSLLCDQWKFPAFLLQAVAYHHAAPRHLEALPDRHPVTDVVNAACRLADLPFKAFDDEGNRRILEGVDAEVLAYHKLDAAILGAVPEILEHARELSAWINQ
jgi:putative nucleotidyltransferase with HDIG domain